MTTVAALCYFLLFLWFISVGVLHMLGRLLQWTACEVARLTRCNWISSGWVLAPLYVVPTAIYLFNIDWLRPEVTASVILSVLGCQLTLVSFPFRSMWLPEVFSLLTLGAMVGVAIG